MINILFGAGASFGSGSCIPYNPPLGNNLFENLFKTGGAFSKLDAEIIEAFNKNGFESGMALIEDNSKVINPLQKEVACYLSKFQVKKENAYVRLFNKIKSCFPDVCITTLNYDLLIEQALTLNGLAVDYNYCDNGVNLLKPHGSSNFLPNLPRGIQIQNVTMKRCGSYLGGLATNVVGSHEEVVNWCKDPHHECISPVLAIYQEGKRVVVNRELIEKTQKNYVDSISKSTLNIIIGIKYVPHDIHIWDSLASSKARLVVVDPYPQDTIVWADTHGLQNVHIIESGFHDAVLELSKIIKIHHSKL